VAGGGRLRMAVGGRAGTLLLGWHPQGRAPAVLIGGGTWQGLEPARAPAPPPQRRRGRPGLPAPMASMKMVDRGCLPPRRRPRRDSPVNGYGGTRGLVPSGRTGRPAGPGWPTSGSGRGRTTSAARRATRARTSPQARWLGRPPGPCAGPGRTRRGPLVEQLDQPAGHGSSAGQHRPPRSEVDLGTEVGGSGRPGRSEGCRSHPFGTVDPKRGGHTHGRGHPTHPAAPR